MPSRSYSRPGSHRSSWTTSSTRLDVRVEATPNRSWTLIRPSPRISMWCRVSSGQEPMHVRLRRGSAAPPCHRRPAGGRGRRGRARTRSCRCRSPRPPARPSPRMSISTPCTMPRGGEIGVEEGRQARHRLGRGRGGHAAAAPTPRSAASMISGAGVNPPVTSTQGRSWPKTRASAARRGSRSQRLDVADLALAEHEHAAAVQVGVESGEREAGLLRLRDGDPALHAGAAGEQLEREGARIGQIAQQRCDSDASHRLRESGHSAGRSDR